MWKAICASVTIVAILLRYFLDPAIAKRKAIEALTREKEDNREDFRKALASGDEDTVAYLLSKRLRRLQTQTPKG